MLGLLNADSNIAIKIHKIRKVLDLNLQNSIPSNLKSLYIDWIEKPSKGKSKEYAYQAAIIDKYVKKKIPIVIFDRYMCISKKEHKWLNKYNVSFFEPALNHRFGYEYLPFPVNLDVEEKLLLEDMKDTERSIDLGFKGNRKNDSFDKYIIDYIKKNPNKNVVYNDDNIDWSDVKWTVAIDDRHNYDIGYLDSNIIKAMEHGCAVMIPTEHKYFIGMFDSIDDMNWITYNINHFSHNMRIATIISTYNTIKELYPEFLLDNIVDRILIKLGG